MCSPKESVSLRIEGRHKRLIEQAASALGQSVAEFARSSLLRHVRDALQGRQVTTLSDRDREIFLSMLDSNTKPNAALRRASTLFRRQRA